MKTASTPAMKALTKHELCKLSLAALAQSRNERSTRKKLFLNGEKTLLQFFPLNLMKACSGDTWKVFTILSQKASMGNDTCEVTHLELSEQTGITQLEPMDFSLQELERLGMILRQSISEGRYRISVLWLRNVFPGSSVSADERDLDWEIAQNRQEDDSTVASIGDTADDEWD